MLNFGVLVQGVISASLLFIAVSPSVVSASEESAGPEESSKYGRAPLLITAGEETSQGRDRTLSEREAEALASALWRETYRPSLSLQYSAEKLFWHEGKRDSALAMLSSLSDSNSDPGDVLLAAAGMCWDTTSNILAPSQKPDLTALEYKRKALERHPWLAEVIEEKETASSAPQRRVVSQPVRRVRSAVGEKPQRQSESFALFSLLSDSTPALPLEKTETQISAPIPEAKPEPQSILSQGEIRDEVAKIVGAMKAREDARNNALGINNDVDNVRSSVVNIPEQLDRKETARSMPVTQPAAVAAPPIPYALIQYLQSSQYARQSFGLSLHYPTRTWMLVPLNPSFQSFQRPMPGSIVHFRQ